MADNSDSKKSYAVYFMEHKPWVYFIDAPTHKEAALAALEMYKEDRERPGTEFIEGLVDEIDPEKTVFEVYDRESEITKVFLEEELESASINDELDELIATLHNKLRGEKE